jgi:hypothetical protein
VRSGGSLSDRLWRWLYTAPAPHPLWSWIPWRERWRAAEIIWIGIGCGAAQLTIKHLGGDRLVVYLGDWYVFPLVVLQYVFWLLGWLLVTAGIVLAGLST